MFKSSKRQGGGGNSAAYLLRRLARDYPDILTAYERGEYPSARAAAITAGIVTVPNTLDRILKLTPKLFAAERVVLRRVLDDLDRYGGGAG